MGRLAEAATSDRSDKHHQDEGLHALLGALVVVVLALALISVSGSFGHTRRISQDAQPLWPTGSFG